MKRIRLTIHVALAALCFLIACEKRSDVGYLNIQAPADGTFEIYRIANESPLQFVSELSGHFNEDIGLAPGSYLVLADCSSETVIIYPGQKTRMTAHRVEFAAPRKAEVDDSFSIQCSRSDKTKSRQMISGHFALNLIHGKRDLLVGMVPMNVDFTVMAEPDRPKTLTYRLSALQVANMNGNYQETAFFVSPVDAMIAATKYQRFGHWEFLLPGRYMIEVNGTRMQVDLSAGQERIIKPAVFKVSTSPEIDLDLPAKIKGSPWLVEINTGHWLNFNESYPVLPGTATISVSGSSQIVETEFVEGQELELMARTVTVDTGCAKAKGEPAACLGERGISLYMPEEPYPFIESVSDIPVIFIDQDLPVLVGIDGSRDIVAEVPASARNRTLQVGYVNLVPQPMHRPGQITDLVRVDTTVNPFSGHTLDINLEHSTLMPLFTGNYKLDQFISLNVGEGSRQSLSKTFTIEAGKTITLEFPTFVSEKKYAQIRKRQSPASGSAAESGDDQAEKSSHGKARMLPHERIL